MVRLNHFCRMLFWEWKINKNHIGRIVACRFDIFIVMSEGASPNLYRDISTLLLDSASYNKKLDVISECHNRVCLNIVNCNDMTEKWNSKQRKPTRTQTYWLPITAVSFCMRENFTFYFLLEFLKKSENIYSWKA